MIDIKSYVSLMMESLQLSLIIIFFFSIKKFFKWIINHCPKGIY